MEPAIPPPPVQPRLLERLGTRILAVAGLFILIVVAVFVLLLGAMTELRRSQAVEQRATRAVAAAFEAEKLAVNLEVGVRGYLVTREERFLDPWKTARSALPEPLDELQRLVASDPGQVAAARALRAELDAYVRGYQEPLVAGTRTRPLSGDQLPEAVSGGKARLDRIRRSFATFTDRERSFAARREARAEAEARRAAGLGLGALAATIGLFIIFAVIVTRTVTGPVRRLTAAAGTLSEGDLSARVRREGPGELRQLADSFNTMAESLETGRHQLRDHARELEAQQERLELANAELARERDQLDRLRRFGEALVRETRLEPLGEAVLARMCADVDAEIGTLYSLSQSEACLRRVAARGLDAGVLPGTLPSSAGLTGHALGERRTISSATGPTVLRMAVPTDRAAITHELHVPLLAGDRAVGVVTLARTTPAPFTPEDRAAVEHLADQAAMAVSNALSLQEARRQAAIKRAVLDATPAAVGLFDPEARMLVENPEMVAVRAEMSRLAPLGAPSQHDVASAIMDPAAFEAALEAAGASLDREMTDEIALGKPPRHLERYRAPVRGDDGQLIGRLVVLRDVTAEREADRLKDEFFALVSHELRTPLTSILGYVELVLEEDEEDELFDPHVRRALRVIERNARRQLRLVGDLLFVAQFEAGTLRLEEGVVDLGAVAADAVEGARPRAADKGVAIDLEVEPLPTCRGDRDRLAQTLDNLISNAVKFTEAGGDVCVRLAAHEGGAVLEVEDTGVGIPTGEQAHLFERFFRATTATENAIPGVGLGLTIVKAIVEGHGGRIAVTSEPGVGTRFQVLIPLRTPAGASGAARSQPEEVTL